MKNNKEENYQLPDLLQKGYFLLKIVGLHPKTLVGLQLPTLVLLGVIDVTPLVIVTIMSFFAISTGKGDAMMILENLQLPAGCLQVPKFLSLQPCSYSF